MPEPAICATFEHLAVLYALGELDAPARAAAEEHARACSGCAGVLQREIVLAEILGARTSASPAEEPSDLLLARCRTRLSHAIDGADASHRPRSWTNWFSLRDWLAAFRFSSRVHPAWSVAALALAGMLAGFAGWQGIGRAPLQRWGPATMTVLAAPALPPAPPLENVVQQPPAQPPISAGFVPEDPHVYSAQDAGMNDARPGIPFDSGAAADNDPHPQASALSFSDEMPPAWRDAPPARPIPPIAWDAPERGRLARLSRRMESLWWGGVRIDPAEQQERLVTGPAPQYPEAARRAGIEGAVTLLLRVGEDGAVQDAQLLSGEPVLGRAASAAVEQWRYSPLRIGGQPVSILTSVTFDFRLR